jgi:hypothetical protein
MIKTVLSLALIFTVFQADAQLSCKQLFKLETELRYSSSTSEKKQLYTLYPNYRKLVERTLENIENFRPTNENPILDISEINLLKWHEQNVRAREVLPESMKKQIVDVHNLLSNTEAMKIYIQKLLEDVGVLMMKESDKMVYAVSAESPSSFQLTQHKVTKRYYLENGQADHNSFRRVLVNRILARDQKISVILPQKHGGFSNNKTKNYKFPDFFDVVRRGPFFDLEFNKRSAHGQDIHLLQMDYVDQALTDRKAFWEYLTNVNEGVWAWDPLFDAFDRSYRQPEFLGPLLRSTLPLN